MPGGGIARSAPSLGTTAAPPEDNRNTQHGSSGGAQNKTERAIGARNRHPNLPTDRRGIMVCLRKFCAGRGAEQERRHSRPLSQKTGEVFDFIFKAKVSKRLQLLVGNARKFSRHPDSQRFAGYWVFIDCQPALDLQIPAGVVDRLEMADDFPSFFSMASVSTGKEPAVWRNPSRLTFVMLRNRSVES